MIEIDMRSQLATLIDRATRVLRSKRAASDPRADAWSDIRDQLEAADAILARVIAADDADGGGLIDVTPEWADSSVYPEEELIDVTCARVARGETRIRKLKLNPMDVSRCWRRCGGQGDPSWLGGAGTIATPTGSVEISGDVDVPEYQRRYFA